jgi:hypothetical protein
MLSLTAYFSISFEHTLSWKVYVFCRQGELKLNPKLYVEETQCVEGFLEVLADLKQKLAEIQVDPLKKFPQVLFLGTGSCIPNKTRNTSSILMHTRYDIGTWYCCAVSLRILYDDGRKESEKNTHKAIASSACSLSPFFLSSLIQTTAIHHQALDKD